MNIPQRHVPGLAVIVRFSEADTREVLAALLDPELHDISQTGVALAERLGTFSAADIENALETVMSLASLRADLGNSIPEFVDELSRSMEEDDREELHPAPEQREQFKKNLRHLLADHRLVIASKAAYLKRDYEHRYCRARILTDIRPVYGEDRTVAPSAALIIHILQLVYHEGRSTKEIHIALGDDDMSALKIQLARAEDKTKSLRALLNSVKLRVIPD